MPQWRLLNFQNEVGITSLRVLALTVITGFGSDETNCKVGSSRIAHICHATLGSFTCVTKHMCFVFRVMVWSGDLGIYDREIGKFKRFGISKFHFSIFLPSSQVRPLCHVSFSRIFDLMVNAAIKPIGSNNFQESAYAECFF